MVEINWIAAVAAGILGFLPGAVWYSKLMFLKAWQAETGIEGHVGNMPESVRMGSGLALSVAAAIVFASFLGPEPPLQQALISGLAVGGAFITTAFGIQYLFEGRSLKLTLINGGYHVVQFLAFGLVLGLWH
jgi:hypothetical protein